MVWEAFSKSVNTNYSSVLCLRFLKKYIPNKATKPIYNVADEANAIVCPF